MVHCVVCNRQVNKAVPNIMFSLYPSSICWVRFISRLVHVLPSPINWYDCMPGRSIEMIRVFIYLISQDDFVNL